MEVSCCFLWGAVTPLWNNLILIKLPVPTRCSNSSCHFTNFEIYSHKYVQCKKQDACTSFWDWILLCFFFFFFTNYSALSYLFLGLNHLLFLCQLLLIMYDFLVTGSEYIIDKIINGKSCSPFQRDQFISKK